MCHMRWSGRREKCSKNRARVREDEKNVEDLLVLPRPAKSWQNWRRLQASAEKLKLTGAADWESLSAKP